MINHPSIYRLFLILIRFTTYPKAVFVSLDTFSLYFIGMHLFFFFFTFDGWLGVLFYVFLFYYLYPPSISIVIAITKRISSRGSPFL